MKSIFIQFLFSSLNKKARYILYIYALAVKSLKAHTLEPKTSYINITIIPQRYFYLAYIYYNCTSSASITSTGSAEISSDTLATPMSSTPSVTP